MKICGGIVSSFFCCTKLAPMLCCQQARIALQDECTHLTVMCMKIIKKETPKEYRTVTLRIEQKIMIDVDKVAEKNKISRQSLIAAVLKQVLADPKFVLKFEE